VTQPGPTLELEASLVAQGFDRVAGIDEVGRGSLAGPVVAAAVIFPRWNSAPDELSGVRDSKQLDSARREQAAERILSLALAVGLGWSCHHVIDREGIAAANRLAMLRALGRLGVTPHALLLDHVRLPTCPLPQTALPKADCLSLSVAAASIIAKVVRDRYMRLADALYPDYGFASHKGYATEMHLAAIAERGACRIHRRSFRPFAPSLLP